jgi:hypothetical protein
MKINARAVQVVGLWQHVCLVYGFEFHQGMDDCALQIETCATGRSLV